MKKSLGILLLMFSALLLYACTGNSGSLQQGSATSSQGQQSSLPAVKEFTIWAKDWQFIPSNITVNKGDLVKITLVNPDVAHGIAIPEFGFDLKAGARETATGEFTAGKEGNYTFFCSVYCGEGHNGMKGVLIVK
ncbi:cytochrome C oxidase subunit II [Candidatus Micrarchaeota archaeon CG06_land_8_20_14_3_00_50_6]|nr:MAG: cytochrome C oxidase subunit II [Candidatus Micrarchaeota archaeon CG06_land_8_20_14_3_00_50_6]